MSDTPQNLALNILVIDDEINIRKTLAMSLETDGHRVVAVSNAQDALAEAARQPFDLALLDLWLGSQRGEDLLPELLGRSPWLAVVIITAHGSIDSVVEVMKRGAVDYLTKPFTPAQVQHVVARVARMRQLERQVADLQGDLGRSDAETILKTNSALMLRAVSLARQVAAGHTTALIRGESGTGKGVLARAIHAWSPRAGKVFSTVSCPALSPALLESELFGHARGAFTGAVRDNPGRIAGSDGGTLFLDEIGELPMNLQPKLLRFVQDREYERVGEARTRHADVRVVAATNVDLDEAVRTGRFREDLLYRINVVQIELPPLRQRPEDIAEMAQRFLAEFGRDRRIHSFTDEAMAAFSRHTWPGNVREMRNVVERAVILCQGERIGLEHLPATLSPGAPPAAEVGDLVPLNQLEEAHIRRVLARTKSLDDAASVLGIDVATLWRRRRKYGI